MNHEQASIDEVDSDRTLTLDQEAVQTIRRALIVGLSSYGEVERVIGYARLLASLGKELPDDFIPSHPTGSDETIRDFASALAYLNSV